LVQKVSDAWGRDPREHDVYDATALAYWVLKQPSDLQARDFVVANTALNSMPQTKAHKTAERLNSMFANYPVKARLLTSSNIQTEVQELLAEVA